MVNGSDISSDALIEAKSAFERIDKINNLTQEGKNSSARVELFFSFDIVDSTAFKVVHTDWAQKIVKQVSRIIDAVTGRIIGATLWRIIGDELVFAYEINDIEDVYQIIDAIYEILIDNQSNYCGDSNKNLKEDLSSATFDTKAAAWIAPVKNCSNGVPGDLPNYDNIRMDYKFENRKIHEFLGTDIDTGFRIKKETERRRLVVSYDWHTC